MTSARTDVAPAVPTREPLEPSFPTAGNCPLGGNHAPIPVQGKNYSVCAKCGARC